MHFDSRIRRYPTSNRRGYRKESSLKLYIGGFRGKDPDFDQKLALAKEVGDIRVIRMCHDKAGYYSANDARATIKHRQRDARGTLRCYKCPACGWYHITHTEQAA